jgi:iron complex transport system substrate-binding protein
MRVISLLPAATDIVAAVGGSEFLVGMTHECDKPAHARAAERVTATTVCDGPPEEVDARVRELITQALCDVCAVRETDVRTLAATMSPPPAIVTLGGTTLDGVLADVERVAAAIGRGSEGASVSAALRVRMRAVHDRLHEAAAPRPTVAVIEWCDPIYLAGHWVPEMVHRAGGRDVAATVGQHSTVSTAGTVASADPAVVLIAPCGYDVARAADAARTLLARDDWRWARDRVVWALDANQLTSRPGPRLIDGIETIASILHPSLFPAPREEFARLVGRR